MFEKALAKKGIYLSPQQLNIVLEIVTDDIKFNRISFKKRTSMNYVIDIAVRSAKVLIRCCMDY